MGQGRDMARAIDPGVPHHDVLENFRDQLMIVLLKRLAVNGAVDIPVAEVDATGHDIVMFAVRDGVFHFELKKKS
ncbi:MAG TPA: hypothetical protein VFA81_04425 [Burkholderiales bacterium]|nr:hypothetical protein [Burkholderiales bacterium]